MMENASWLMKCLESGAHVALAVVLIKWAIRFGPRFGEMFPDEPWRESLRPDEDDER